MLMDILINSDIEGMIVCESATKYHSLTRYNDRPLTLSLKTQIPLKGATVHIYPGKDFDLSHTQLVEGSLYVTTVERTICDLIKNHCEDRLLFESLETYFIRYGGFYKLLQVAEELKVKEEVSESIAELEDWQKDFYE